jgi:UDP-N-acetylmuramoyl-tripeptide--D-alanyl-D-alanine ligase
MGWLTLAQIATLAGGRLAGEDAPVASLSTDTRALQAGQLFVALQGPRFDAHELVLGGKAARATGVMVSRCLDTALAQVLVDDTQVALARLAGAWRERVSATVVGLTGSNGKTTVKEMIAAILSREGPLYATRGNLNNHIGVPLTLSNLRPHHAYAVVEMGANHPGEIAALTRMVRPHIALITNAAAAHLEGFGDLDGVARAKGEIFEGLSETGVGVINTDDAFADHWRARLGARDWLGFGFSKAAHVRGEWASDGALQIQTPVASLRLRMPLAGRHNAMNALAAVAVAHALGMDLGRAGRALESCRPVVGRLTPYAGIRGVTILDDSYNANPASLRAALEVLTSRHGPHWLVLGDMGELGADADRLHREAGVAAREAGAARLLALGPLSRAAVAAFGAGASHFPVVEELIAALRAELEPGVSVLVKGSRAMRMERVVNALKPGESGADKPLGGREDAA